MRQVTRKAVLTAIALVVLMGGVVSGPAAQADHGILTTAPVNLRTGPSTEHPVIAIVPAGVSPDYDCYITGESVEGVRVWFQVTFDGQTGFVTSFYDDSSYDSPEEIPETYGISACSTGSTAAMHTGTDVTDCSGNDYVTEVNVQDYTEGQFDVLVTPTSNSRYAQLNGYGQEATWEIWDAVQDCVPGLYGDLADGIYQQIECHVLGGLSGPFNAGGPEYGLESWRPKTSWAEMISSKCNWGDSPYTIVGEPYRTDLMANQPEF